MNGMLNQTHAPFFAASHRRDRDRKLSPEHCHAYEGINDAGVNHKSIMTPLSQPVPPNVALHRRDRDRESSPDRRASDRDRDSNGRRSTRGEPDKGREPREPSPPAAKHSGW